MSEDYFEPRRIPPVWRRIFILLAVIAAVPVVMWCITAFVRAYVAPPKVPTFRPIASATSAMPTATTASITPVSAATLRVPLEDAKPAAAAAAPKPPEKLPPIVEARRTATDARPAVPVETAPPALRAPPPEAVTLSPSEPPAAAASPAPVKAIAPLAQSPSPAVDPAPAPAVEDVPPGEPIAGPVPLPPHRPRVIALGPGGIPVPRPRPPVSDPGTASPALEGELTQRDYMN